MQPKKDALFSHGHWAFELHMFFKWKPKVEGIDQLVSRPRQFFGTQKGRLPSLDWRCFSSLKTPQVRLCREGNPDLNGLAF